MLVAAGDHAGARRHALRRGDVTAGEAHALARERIEVWRADVAIHTLRAEVSPAVVVAVDENDVGFRRRRAEGSDRGEEREAEG